MNNNVDFVNFILAIIVLGSACTLLFVLWFFRHQVKVNSTRLKTLNMINGQYIFHTDIMSKSYYASTETKRQFDRFDFSGYMQSIISENRSFYTDQIGKCENNAARYQEYIGEIQAIPKDSIKKDAKRCNMNAESFEKYENKLMKKSIKNPIRGFTATCRLSYISPKGRSRYWTDYSYTYDEIKTAYYNSEHSIITKEMIAYERALVSDSLRYDIFQRDGFRCQICGCTQRDGVTLHVDHIIPVSKGGKSVPSNLRTLCDRCNIGKSNKYNPNGIN